jgi:GDPmannose 4,6-dehydratase
MKTNKFNKLAMVSGVTGQDGSYMCDLLLSKGYDVIGLHRRNSTNNFQRISHILDNTNFKLEECDITDSSNVNSIISKYQPDEFYNLAAQSHVGTSFKQPSLTFEIDTIGVINILESIKNYSNTTKFYQASTSEMFGKNFKIGDDGLPYQDENTEFIPQSPYGVAKLASHRMVQIYRGAYGLFACSGILFNHESPRRGENFVTRKITKYIGQVVNHLTNDSLKLGNLSAHRDWGHAQDYVRAMWLMLQSDVPDDYVVASEDTWSVFDFLRMAFEYAGLDYTKHVEIDENLYRPAEVEYLRGKTTKAQNQLDWHPEISFEDMVKDMVDSDIETLSHV